MPYCAHCATYFCPQTHSSPAESCECGADVSVAELREEYFRDREPSEDELEQRRSERLSPFYPHGGVSSQRRGEP